MTDRDKSSLAVLQFEGGKVEIMVVHAAKDDAIVVFVDTEDAGRIRLNLNDGVIYDGDPNTHHHTMCTCTERSRS